MEQFTIVNSKTLLEFKTKLDKLWKNSRYDIRTLLILFMYHNNRKRHQEKESRENKPLGLNIVSPMTTSKTTSKRVKRSALSQQVTTIWLQGVGKTA